MTDPMPSDATHLDSPTAMSVERSLQQFETRLSERTKIPPNKLGEYMSWPEDRLKRESSTVSRVLRRFAEAVVDSMENPGAADRFLHDLDLKSISRDHDWRAIFSTIRAQEAGYEGYKRAVLIKYLQYLSFRKRLVEYVCASRRGLEETHEYSDITLFALRFNSQGPSVANHRLPRDPNYIRLPLGESVDLELPHGLDLSLMLAAHVFHLRGASPPTLTDQNGVSHALRVGRNTVGRHPEGDIVANSDFNDISRAHLILEWDGAHRMRLIDFSSRGTYVHRDALASPSEANTVPNAQDTEI